MNHIDKPKYPPAKHCFGYLIYEYEKNGRLVKDEMCTALKELYCKTSERCPFYKSKKEVGNTNVPVDY